jgi:mannosyl-oligosaccharide glucosidase
MKGYGWDEFDARTGGVQTMYDEGNGIDIVTTFVKIPGGSHGGSWAARIRGKMRDDSPGDLRSTVVFYAGLQGLGSLEVENDVNTVGYEGDVVLKGDSQGLGEYKLVITGGRGDHPKSNHAADEEKPLDHTFVNSVQAPEAILWQTKAVFFRQLKEQIDKYIDKYGEQNAPPPAQVYTIPHKPGLGNLYMI